MINYVSTDPLRPSFQQSSGDASGTALVAIDPESCGTFPIDTAGVMDGSLASDFESTPICSTTRSNRMRRMENRDIQKIFGGDANNISLDLTRQNKIPRNRNRT